MDVLLTWNCCHMDNPHALPKTKAVVREMGRHCPDIMTPKTFLENLCLLVIYSPALNLKTAVQICFKCNFSRKERKERIELLETATYVLTGSEMSFHPLGENPSGNSNEITAHILCSLRSLWQIMTFAMISTAVFRLNPLAISGSAFGRDLIRERRGMAKLESFACAGEVPGDSVGIAAAIQHGDYGYVVANGLGFLSRGGWQMCAFVVNSSAVGFNLIRRACMKKLLLSVMLVASACAFAKEATMTSERVAPCENCMKTWTPFALTLCGPVGLPWGDWNVYGMQLGVVNSVYEFSGLQLGVVNIATRAYGVQIGVINVITSNDIPFLPIVNWNF